jgi:hypothetical protein
VGSSPPASTAYK